MDRLPEQVLCRLQQRDAEEAPGGQAVQLQAQVQDLRGQPDPILDGREERGLEPVTDSHKGARHIVDFGVNLGRHARRNFSLIDL